MPKRRLQWQLFPSYLLIAVAAVVALGWTTLRLFESYSLASLRHDLQARADFLDGQLGSEIPPDRSEFARLAGRYDRASKIRIALLLPGGDVEFDSRNRPEELLNQLERPELKQALAGSTGDAIRYNAGLDTRVLYMAVPVMRSDRLFGLLYLSQPLTALDQAVARLQSWIWAMGLATVVLATGASWWAARRIERPLESMAIAARRLASGQWGARTPVPDTQELGQLADDFNRMADHLQERIGVLIQHNNEQKAVLASMAEGVLAVDSQERIISLNTASSRLLGIDHQQAQGRRLQEVVRNADLSRFISRALKCREPIEADVLLHGHRERVMQARGSALHDLEGRPIGAVIVLNDVTDFRRLEHIRRDFVANVSHELKTPITSIKGFVETLLDGALQSPEDAERFLRIIAKQADRLHAIIEDLLSLSKIEQSEDADDIALEPTVLRGLLESAVHACTSVAQDRQIQVTLDCPADLQVQANPLLLEQAVVNLLDNAIKYSDPGRPVELTVVRNGQEVTLSVTDRGCGIATEHHSRIFERFYRVDRARSRKLGGTGLGLAIVKHIAQAHHGNVTVDSTLGVGSTFSIHLPKAL